METKAKRPADGKVRVTANPATGDIFTLQTENGSPKLDKNGDRFGYIRLEQRKLILDDKSYFGGGVEKRSALRAMTEAAWNKVADSYEDGMVIPGTIVHEDSLKQEHNGFKARRAGEEGELLTADKGKQIYRNTYFTTNENATDTIIDFENDLRVNKTVLTEKDKNTQSLN